ncbi:MAG: glycosyltransferase [Bacteroidetes bacterium]|jgi:polysaccharide biosynthesis protein PslH|nr:glycosyltransferase [Bacteroidota bacterium]
MESKGLKILQVSNRVPFPLNEGGTIGIYNYTKGFSEAGCSVTLFALAAKKHHIDHQQAKVELTKYCTYHVYPIDTDVKPIPAFLNLFTNKSYNVERFYDSDFENALTQHLQNNQYDIIQIEGTFPARYSTTIFANKNKAKVVLRQHNVEYQIWERLSKNSRNPIKKWYLNLLAKRLKQFEQQHLNQYDALIPVTVDDGELFKKLGCSAPIFPSPAGIDTQLWDISQSAQNVAIYHIGSLEWMPNVEAVEWFIDDVWPLLLAQFPEQTFYVAGKGMPAEFKNRTHKGVEMIGEVASATDFIKDKGITVVPLKSGSGIRLKILEAMSAGKIVVSTTIGAQGIDCTDGKDILIADTPTEFVSAFQRLNNDPALSTSLKLNARKLIEQQYSNQSVVNRLIGFYQSL